MTYNKRWSRKERWTCPSPIRPLKLTSMPRRTWKAFWIWSAIVNRWVFNQMHVESVDLIRDLSDQDLQRKCETPGGAPIAVWKWLRAMIEHEVHHRGQIYMMLGMLGVETPPLWGLREEELVERSNR